MRDVVAGVLVGMQDVLRLGLVVVTACTGPEPAKEAAPVVEAKVERYWSTKAPFPSQSAGRGDGLDHCVALTITVGAKPTVAGEIISEGDRDGYCFTEDTVAEEENRELDEAEYVGGSRLWSVVVSNARGDFFHENLALYDSQTKQYWDPLTDERTKAVPDGTEEWPMHASPDGTWGIYGDKIVSLDEAKVVGTIAGSFCGWE